MCTAAAGCCSHAVVLMQLLERAHCQGKASAFDHPSLCPTRSPRKHLQARRILHHRQHPRRAPNHWMHLAAAAFVPWSCPVELSMDVDSIQVTATGNTWLLKQILDDLDCDVSQIPEGWFRQQGFQKDGFSTIAKPLVD